jgi:Resolvase, N terminal domain
MKIAIYLRVSTDRQTTDSQAVELRDYCTRRGWKECGSSLTHHPARNSVEEGARVALGETVVVGVVDTTADGEIASPAEGALGGLGDRGQGQHE